MIKILRLFYRGRANALTLRGKLSDIHHHKYISYRKVIVNWIKYRHVQYQLIKDRESVKRFKTSDTIFILGSGPSINKITPEQWAEIDRHDSFGINFSFLLNYVPTYHLQELNPLKVLQQTFMKVFRTRKAKYRNVVWCCNNKMLQRFGHPRLTPFFFPEQPVCYCYKLPPAISLKEDRPFRDEDFEQSLLYRGTLTQVLELTVNHFGYRNIVLLGVDLNTYDHFYSNMPEMQELWALAEQNYANKQKMFPLMIPKKGKERPIDDYIYSLAGYLKRRRQVILFTGLMNNMLYPRLPAYFE